MYMCCISILLNQKKSEVFFMKLNGSEIIAECLLEQGVDTVFGYPGGAVLNIYDALYKYSDKITHILSAHEQGASHAADGYARVKGYGALVTTFGVGELSAINWRLRFRIITLLLNSVSFAHKTIPKQHYSSYRTDCRWQPMEHPRLFKFGQ